MKEKVDKIINHKIDCFISRQLIYNYPEQMFTANGIMAIEHADFEGVEQLAKVLGSEIVSTFDHPDKVKIGSCKLIEEVSRLRILHQPTFCNKPLLLEGYDWRDQDDSV